MTIDVFADIACPWCFIGERRLFAALRRRPGSNFEVNWRPFQLQPDFPPAGQPWEAFVEAKFGDRQRAQTMFDHVARAGESHSIRFNFDDVANAPNTAEAHRLILAASRSGLTWEVADRLFGAYFEEGRDICAPSTLLAIAAEAGLDRAETKAYFASGAGREEVAQSQLVALDMGITGVPCFVFDGRYAVSGARLPDVLLQVIDEVRRDAA